MLLDETWLLLIAKVFGSNVFSSKTLTDGDQVIHGSMKVLLLESLITFRDLSAGWMLLRRWFSAFILIILVFFYLRFCLRRF